MYLFPVLTVLCIYLSSQGEIVLNSTTTTDVLPEKGDKKHRFLVVCGKTGKEFEICADDKRSRNEWLLDIDKVVIRNSFYIMIGSKLYMPHAFQDLLTQARRQRVIVFFPMCVSVCLCVIT